MWAFPRAQQCFCGALAPVHPSGVCVRSCTCASACFELALCAWSRLAFVVAPFCLRAQFLGCLRLILGFTLGGVHHWLSLVFSLDFSASLLIRVLLAGTLRTAVWRPCWKTATSPPSLSWGLLFFYHQFFVCSYPWSSNDPCFAFATRSHSGLLSSFRRRAIATRGGTARPRALDELLGKRERFLGHNCLKFQCLL